MLPELSNAKTTSIGTVRVPPIPPAPWTLTFTANPAVLSSKHMGVISPLTGGRSTLSGSREGSELGNVEGTRDVVGAIVGVRVGVEVGV